MTDSETNKPSRARRAVSLIKDRALPQLLLALSGAGLAASGYPNIPWDIPRGAVAAGAVLLGVLGSGLALRDRSTRAGLGEQLARERAGAQRLRGVAEALPKSLLETIAKRQKWSTGVRLNLYLKRPEGFALVGRYSMSTAMTDSTQTHYDLHKGCLGKAWDLGHDILEAPDATADPTGWSQAQRQCGYTEEEIEQMRMRSRTYVALRLQNHAGQGALGVVLVESQLGPAHFDPQKVIEVLRGEADHLTGTLYALR